MNEEMKEKVEEGMEEKMKEKIEVEMQMDIDDGSLRAIIHEAMRQFYKDQDLMSIKSINEIEHSETVKRIAEVLKKNNLNIICPVSVEP